MGTICTLGGFPCLASSPVRWALKAGVQPYTTTVDLAPSHADQLLKITQAVGKPTTLRISTGNGPDITIQNVWVIHNSPAENYNLSRVTIADRRWMWAYSHVVGRYNIRRRVGVNRITVNDQPANDVVTDSLQYAKWSLQKNLTKWAARAVLIDVLTKAENVSLDTQPPVIIATGLGNKLANLPVDDLSVNDPGHEAVMRVLGYLPEGELFIDYDGSVVVYSKASDGERTLVANLGPEIVGRGHVEGVDFSLLRPSAVEVYFTRECEVRFNFNEGTSTRTEDERYCDNVGPQPDYSLSINGKTYPAGTWHTFPEYLSAWGNLPNPFGGAASPLTQTIIRKAMVPFMDLWAAIGAIGQYDYTADWTGRISMVLAHWRQTFRINQQWVDKILSIRPYRVATVDQVTGSRAPAMAFSDYCKLATTRAQWKNREGGHQGLEYAINKTGYAATLNSSSSPSPAVVSVLDSDQGILHLDYVGDPLKLYEIVLPSMLDTGNRPTGNIAQAAKSITFDSINSPGATLPSLAANFHCAIIVTVVPAAPNNLTQYHRLKVTPEMVASMVPGGSIGPCNGPVMQVYIGAGIETARVQWLDSRSTEIEKCFGIGQGANEEPQQPNLTGLVINEGTPGGPSATGGASLWSIAKAEAARIYASLRDRKVGTKAGILTKLSPDGWVDEVVHEVGIQGDITTHVSLPERVPKFSLVSFLDSDTRARVLRLVQQ